MRAAKAEVPGGRLEFAFYAEAKVRLEPRVTFPTTLQGFMEESTYGSSKFDNCMLTMLSILRSLFASKPSSVRPDVSSEKWEEMKAEVKKLSRDRSRTYLMKAALPAEPPNDDWMIIWGCNEFDGIEGFYIENNTANFTSKRTGETFVANDTRGNSYTFHVERLRNKAGQEVDAACCEVSPGVYASGVRKAKL